MFNASVTGPFIVTVPDGLVPEYDPLPLPLHEANVYWQPDPHDDGDPETPKLNEAPLLYQPLAGEPDMPLPPPPPFAVK
jgi:hypothetical protein